MCLGLDADQYPLSSWSSFCHLCVEDPLIRADDMLVTEEEVKVLQGLCQEKRLLHIILVSPNLAKGNF